jgi:hypothetical protein
MNEKKYGDILEFLEKRKSKPKHKYKIRKHIGLIKNISKACIGTVILTIGVIISLFGIRYTETCVITAIMGVILFFVGLWMIFMKAEK